MNKNVHMKSVIVQYIKYLTHVHTFIARQGLINQFRNKTEKLCSEDVVTFNY